MVAVEIASAIAEPISIAGVENDFLDMLNYPYFDVKFVVFSIFLPNAAQFERLEQ